MEQQKTNEIVKLNYGVILARFQPIHNGHLALIEKACNENDKVLVLIGSIDKMNKRNPIPWTIRRDMVIKALEERGLTNKVEVKELSDLSDESHNDHEWGFYLYSNIVSLINKANFSIYYSDGFEIITSWFPGFILRNNVSLSLLARNATESGISATQIREMIMKDDEDLKKWVPTCVYENKEQIKAFLNVFK